MSRASENLSQHTLIKAPSDIAITQGAEFVIEGMSGFDPAEYLSVAPSFKFRRSKELIVADISEVSDFEDGLFLDNDYVSAIRYFLESLWMPKNEGFVDYEQVAAIAASKIKSYKLPGADNPNGPHLVEGVHSEEGTSFKDVAKDSIIAEAKVPDTNEIYYYLLSTLDADPLTLSDFIDDENRLERYLDTWENKVDVIKRVFPKGTQLSSRHEYLDLSVGALMEFFPYLANVNRSTLKLKAQLEKQMSDSTDFRMTKALHQELGDIALELASIKRSMANLQSFASSRGYILITEDGKREVTYRGKKATQDVKEGQLLQQYSFESTWVEEYKVHKSRRRLFRSRKRWTVTRRRTRKAIDIGLRLIRSPDENLNDFLENSLISKGMEPIVFENNDQSLLSQDGRTVDEVLELCDMDPMFRKRCAILLPTYTQTLFGDDVVSGFHVIREPQRGKAIIGMPDYFVEESLSYRFRWLGCELGELVSSINLLPGEEREISIKTTRSSLREHELKSTTNVENESSSSFDTLTSVENEFQKENKSEKTKSWSAKASGSYGGISGGVSASGTSKKSARQFARTLNKVSSKAVSKMRRKTKQEVVARELTRESAENTSSSSGTIVNPNVGRTLNINFFTVNNVYSSGTFLDEFGFLYVSPFEMIDGTGVRQTFYFDKEDAADFIERALSDVEVLASRSLRMSNPKLSEADYNKVIKTFVTDYSKELRSGIFKSLEDYSLHEDAPDAVASERSPVNALLAKDDEHNFISVSQAAKSGRSIADVLKDISTTDAPIEPTLLSSPSKALYAESGLGNNEALEGYAVDMRRLEVEKQLTDIMVTQDSLGKKTTLQNQVYRNVSYKRIENKITLKVGGKIELGSWDVFLAGANLGSVEVTKNKLTYELLVEDQSNLPNSEDYPMALVKS